MKLNILRKSLDSRIAAVAPSLLTISFIVILVSVDPTAVFAEGQATTETAPSSKTEEIKKLEELRKKKRELQAKREDIHTRHHSEMKALMERHRKETQEMRLKFRAELEGNRASIKEVDSRSRSKEADEKTVSTKTE